MARKHNPTARMVGMQRNPTGSVEAFRSILKRYLPKLYSLSKSEYQTILDEFDQYPYDAKNFVLVAFDKLRHRRKALIKPSKDVPFWYKHEEGGLLPLGYFSSRSAAGASVSVLMTIPSWKSRRRCRPWFASTWSAAWAGRGAPQSSAPPPPRARPLHRA